MMMENMMARPVKAFFANTYPAMALVMQTKIIEAADMNTLLKNHLSAGLMKSS